MTAPKLSRKGVEHALRTMMRRLAAESAFPARSVWEQRSNSDGSVTGLMIFQSTPHLKAPVVVWIDGGAGELAITAEYLIDRHAKAVETVLRTSAHVAGLEPKFRAALQHAR